MIMATKALLNENPQPTPNEIKHGLSGNLCRCGTYGNVVNAVLAASGQMPIRDGGGG
jgi:carbon-monoxide dehydrogenase small subunit